MMSGAAFARDEPRQLRTTVYLIRHGAVVGSETRRFIGHLDVPLSALGRRQLAAVAARLSYVRLAAVYSSDLGRARESAAIVAAPHRLPPAAVPALREFAMGDWEGLTGEEIEARDAPGYRAWMSDVGRFQFPRGENLDQVAARAWPAFARIAARHAGTSVAVIAHGGSNRAILCRALGIPLGRILALGQDYAALSVLAGARDRWALRLLNQAEPAAPP
ncbi:MAG: histidine phosphatase family protein [Candidatus Rokubacteria bacterium]|nr:histidine phosphatase family protein [Candidatus Rokubacteria bacterium]